MEYFKNFTKNDFAEGFGPLTEAVVTEDNENQFMLNLTPVLMKPQMQHDFVEGEEGEETEPEIREDDIREIEFQINFGDDTGCFFDASQIKTVINPSRMMAHSDSSCEVIRDGIKKVKLKHDIFDNGIWRGFLVKRVLIY